MLRVDEIGKVEVLESRVKQQELERKKNGEECRCGKAKQDVEGLWSTRSWYRSELEY